MLTIVEQSANDSVVKALEEALVEARAGNIVAVAIAGVTREGIMAQNWSDGSNLVQLLGSVARLSFVLNTEFEDQCS